MPINKSAVLDYFGSRQGRGHGQLLYETAYYLLRIIFANRDFDSLDELMTFCGDSENLRPWLASETDRTVFSAAIRDGLHDMIAGRNIGTRPARGRSQVQTAHHGP